MHGKCSLLLPVVISCLINHFLLSADSTSRTTSSEVTSDIRHSNHFILQDNTSQTNPTLPFQLATPSRDLSSPLPVSFHSEHLNGVSDKMSSWNPLVPEGAECNIESAKAISSPYAASPGLSTRGRGSGGRESESSGVNGLEDDDVAGK